MEASRSSSNLTVAIHETGLTTDKHFKNGGILHGVRYDRGVNRSGIIDTTKLLDVPETRGIERRSRRVKINIPIGASLRGCYRGIKKVD